MDIEGKSLSEKRRPDESRLRTKGVACSGFEIKRRPVGRISLRLHNHQIRMELVCSLIGFVEYVIIEIEVEFHYRIGDIHHSIRLGYRTRRALIGVSHHNGRVKVLSESMSGERKRHCGYDQSSHNQFISLSLASLMSIWSRTSSSAPAEGL